MKTPLIYEYTLNNTQLVRVSVEKDLKVTITGTLSGTLIYIPSPVEITSSVGS